MSQQSTIHVPDGPDEDLAGGIKSEKSTPDGPVNYPGSGTYDEPFVVDWDVGDTENPYNWPKSRKWAITFQLAIGTWTVSFCSSCYSGGLIDIENHFGISQEVAILGVSLYVLGFGIGPLFYAPLSEIFGRRIIFLCSFAVFALFQLGGSLGQNAATVIVFRGLAGLVGSSPLANAGGSLSDIWIARERGTAAAIYSTAPFLGPVIGPIVGGWIAETRLGWRFNFWIMLIVAAFSWTLGFLITPETYAPVLLRRRARRLTKEANGQLRYISKYDSHGSVSFLMMLRRNMTRPFLFLVTEPIVLLMAVYISIAYAILYAFFAAFPIVFQDHRGFSTGEGGLTFLGVGLGTLIGTCLAPLNNKLYYRAADRSISGHAPPEARLYFPMIGGPFLPIGLFWFAWTTQPSIPWISPVLAGIPFGLGVAAIMQGLQQYLMDAYGIYCASALASTIVLRCIVAAIFPLISPVMFQNLGDQWACSVFAFLALVCTPLPFLFYRYGSWIRDHSKFALKDRDIRSSTISPRRPTHDTV